MTPPSLPTDKSPDPSAQADEDAVMRAFLAGTPVDADVARRVQIATAGIREESFRKHGPVGIAVPAIRELRDPLP